MAPKVSWLGAPADPSRKRPFWGEASTIGIGAVALVGVTGAAVAGAALTGAAPSSSSNQNSSSKKVSFLGGAGSNFTVPPSWARPPAPSESSATSSDGEGSDGEGVHYESDFDEADDDNSTARKPGAGKLWTNALFPEGMEGPSNWDLLNLSAAQEWRCPCPDRSCLSKERYPKPDPLYDFRKTFQTKSKGLRDTFRKNFTEVTFSSHDGSFARAIRIGGHNDNCIAAAGVACGISFATFANARADTRKSRPWHAKRANNRDKLESDTRVHLEAYIRDLRSTMEGSKGSDEIVWHTGKRSGALRWSDYKKHRMDRSLPVIGSQALFVKLWVAHAEIRQHGVTGHALCVQCGECESERDELEGRTDKVADGRRVFLDAKEAAHAEEHMGERRYAENAWYQGETYPTRMTTIRIDAPTQHQFDLPRQRKISRDIVKSLDQARWASKITGAQVAGAGMYACVARAALGGPSGPNLVLTVLMLTLVGMMESGIVLGSFLQLILDNTAGENKCNAVIVTLAWLVYYDVFQESGFFCMLVGHTNIELDQSFNTMTTSMLQYPVYTVSSMIGLITRFLTPYGIRKVFELPHLWDFSGQLLPHAHKLGGYCTGQHGDGMHEYRLKKDAHGVVRLRMRKSSKSSGWVPEGPGYEVFKSTPPPPCDMLPAPFKPDSKWNRSTVEATIRQWLPFMAISEDHREATRQEWTNSYFSLPPDVQPSQLISIGRSLLPKLDLQPRRWATESQPTLPVNNPSARLENPIIDPTFNGVDRTTADVQRETSVYRQQQRASATSAFEPIFQGDYVLVQLAGAALALQQVCNGVFLQQADEEHMCFTTVEYTHTPEVGVHGLWGSFHKTANINYDPKDPKSGAKFARHHSIGRDSITVYNVQVWVDTSFTPKRLRLDVPSLQKLAAVRPIAFPLPTAIPASHTDAQTRQTRQPPAAGDDGSSHCSLLWPPNRPCHFPQPILLYNM